MFGYSNFFHYVYRQSDFYEDFSSYHLFASEEFSSISAKIVKEKMHQTKQGIWCHYTSHNILLPNTGWKIHVSCKVAEGIQLLSLIVPYLAKNKIQFKHALDTFILQIINSKAWYRGGAGKFVTIYPKSKSDFLKIIDDIANLTKSYEGPYILSDFRYKNSTNVFYRYGSIMPNTSVNIYGEQENTNIMPDGNVFKDQRLPYPVVPEWEKNPFQTEKKGDASNIVLNGRYKIMLAIQFSNSGGVYKALDMETNKNVIIKEARPFIDIDKNNDDAVSRLNKEYRALKILENIGFTPKPIDFFKEWENSFLVEEYIDGMSFNFFRALDNPVIESEKNVTEEDTQKFWIRLFSILKNILSAIIKIHDNGVLFGDIAPTNIILISDEDYSLKLIDLEGAHIIGERHGVRVATPGFYEQDQFGKDLSLKDDYFAIGNLIINQIFPFNNYFMLNKNAKKTFFSEFIKRNKIPQVFYDIIRMLTEEKYLKKISNSEKDFQADIINKVKHSRTLSDEIKNIFKGVNI